MDDKKLKIGIVGQSGSGKGTQKKLLSKILNLPAVSMGDLLRASRDAGDERATEISKALDAGVHVDNSITNDIIMEWIAEYGENGYIIEGFPRNREQFDFFETQQHFTHVLALNISDEEVKVRITGRRNCPCGKTYHMKYNPPKNNETCDECGAKLTIRTDSSPEATKERIRLYHEEMEPLLDKYRESGILHEVDGEQEIEKVQKDLQAIFGYNN